MSIAHLDIDIDTSTMAVQRTDDLHLEVWVPPASDLVIGFPGPTGKAGPPGSQWYSGTGPPPATLGENVNDHYLDEDTGDVWRIAAVTPPPVVVDDPNTYGSGTYGSGTYGGI